MRPAAGYKYENKTIAMLYADQKPGHCALCECRLRYTGFKQRRICEDRLCVRAWHRLYRIDRSNREGRKPRELREH